MAILIGYWLMLAARCMAGPASVRLQRQRVPARITSRTQAAGKPNAFVSSARRRHRR